MTTPTPPLASVLPEYFTSEELAQLLRCSLWTIYGNASKHPERIPPFARVCGRLLFRRTVVEAWIASRGAPPGAPPALAAPRRRGRPTIAEARARAMANAPGAP